MPCLSETTDLNSRPNCARVSRHDRAAVRSACAGYLLCCRSLAAVADCKRILCLLVAFNTPLMLLAPQELLAQQSAGSTPTQIAAQAEGSRALDGDINTVDGAIPRATMDSCLVADFRRVVSFVPAYERPTNALDWLAEFGDRCSYMQLLEIKNNRPSWMGVADGHEVAVAVDRYLERRLIVDFEAQKARREAAKLGMVEDNSAGDATGGVRTRRPMPATVSVSPARSPNPVAANAETSRAPMDIAPEAEMPLAAGQLGKPPAASAAPDLAAEGALEPMAASQAGPDSVPEPSNALPAVTPDSDLTEPPPATSVVPNPTD